MEIKPYHDCLNVCFDNAGAVYEIPNYCINDPFEYIITSSESLSSSKPAQKKIKIIIRKVVEEVGIECLNSWTVLELKNNIKSIGELVITKPENIRLFHGGKELRDNEELWFYHIDNGSIVQLMYREVGL
jgi:hypothetical protein